MIVEVLSPAAGDPYEPVAAGLLDGYRVPFAARGLTLRPRPWNLGPGEGDATLALFAWGYHFDVARWSGMLADWPADRLLLNQPALLLWNTRKTYLRNLELAGIPIVPSVFGTADTMNVAAAFDTFDTDEMIVKPQISAGSHLTVRLRRGDTVARLDDAILQPFVPAILEEGELSFLFIGGVFSHAVRKVAKPGDFRIQPQFGGVFTRFDPDPAELALAERVIAAAPASTLYARVDLIRLDDGTLALMELEAIEPDLYPALAPEARDALAVAVLAAIAG